MKVVNNLENPKPEWETEDHSVSLHLDGNYTLTVWGAGHYALTYKDNIDHSHSRLLASGTDITKELYLGYKTRKGLR
jgi:hypothetical protein